MPCRIFIVMKGIIVVNAYIKNASQISQAERIRQELALCGVNVSVVKNFMLADIRGGEIRREDCDFCVFLDKDRACARLLQRSGVRLFNRAEAVEVCDDKFLTHIALCGHGIDMPDSVYAPLCYDADALPDGHFLRQVAERLGFPLVAKNCYGSLGAGVFLLKDAVALSEFEKNHLLTAHFYQKFVDCGGGEDVRVIVVGGRYVCAMRRTNQHDFRSNIELGGVGENFEADTGLISLCEKTARILNLDYCGIDVLTDGNGKRLICEVNSNAFFAAAERCCGKNIAKRYAEWIVGEMKSGNR